MTDAIANASTREAYNELIKLTREANLLGTSAGLLGWDQEVKMPPKGQKFRGEQLALLARLSHQMRTNPKIGELLAVCEDDTAAMSDPHGDVATNVRELRRGYDRQTKLPAELVEEFAKVTSEAKSVWAEARKEKNFAKFQPHLAKVVELTRRKAECFGWPEGGEPWDALADQFEPGSTAKDVTAVFTPLRERLVKLLQELMGGSKKPANAFNEVKLPIDQQEKFVRMIVAQLGFDFDAGRLDTSTHPFCGGTHCFDVRMTTRFHEDNLNDAIGSTMHETGHGLYEQGLPSAGIGLPTGDSVSLGIHESQSRMWENQVGRSRAFWEWCTPKLHEHFGAAVKHLTLEDVYGGANIVKPDFIRVEADEATYNMHVMIRFEIERGMVSGKLDVKDIPEVWNARYKEYLDVVVPDDSKGCLQDIHWSMGAIGYFPTYTLGNLYCAQFFEKALADMPGLTDEFRKGEFSSLKKWLNENIHAHGMRYSAADLCVKVTGKPLSADPLMRHLEGKLRPLYGVG
ncbi:MAG: carboxypeptidase M32 [Planctomycetota bacterium]